MPSLERKLKTSTGLEIEKPIKEYGEKILKKLNELESILLFDKRFAELWDKNVMPPRMLRPYSVVNDIDKDDIPYLEVIRYIILLLFDLFYYYYFFF